MGALVFFESASELATLTNTFSVAGTPTDPTTISLIVTNPEGTATTYTFAAAEITKSSTGVYTKDITCSIAGTWSYEWVGTGDVVDTEAGTWDVQEAALGRLYCTVEALRSRLFGDTADTGNSFEVHMACFATSRAVEQYCQRIFWRGAASTRTFVPTEQYLLKLPVFCDLVSVTALATDAGGDGTFGTTWTAGQYQLLPLNPDAAPETRPYTKVKPLARAWPCASGALTRDDRIQIEGVWGWPAVPYAVKQSALITAAEVFRSKSTFEAQMGYDEMAQMVLRRNPIARDLLKPYRHPLAAVLMA